MAIPPPSGFRTPLLLDTDVQYIGNSPGADDRGRVHVLVANKDTEAIPVFFSESGTGKFFDYSAVQIGIGPTILISHIVTAPIKLKLTTLGVSCRMESICQVTLNSVEIATLRTGAAQPSTQFTWAPGRDCLPGDLIEVTLTRRTGSPDVLVGAHLMGLEL